jgi:protein involved in sex pheromone biosynthesis
MKNLLLVTGLSLTLLLTGCFDHSDSDKSSNASQDKASVQMQRKDDAPAKQ